MSGLPSQLSSFSHFFLNNFVVSLTFVKHFGTFPGARAFPSLATSAGWLIGVQD